MQFVSEGEEDENEQNDDEKSSSSDISIKGSDDDRITPLAVPEPGTKKYLNRIGQNNSNKTEILINGKVYDEFLYD